MPGFATAVYVLSFLTSATCSGLLIRSYAANRTRLLLWCAICFSLLALSNFFVICDLVLFPDIDLSYFRTGFALAAIVPLLYGFIWELD